jgi:hypothetical protein
MLYGEKNVWIIIRQQLLPFEMLSQREDFELISCSELLAYFFNPSS